MTAIEPMLANPIWLLCLTVAVFLAMQQLRQRSGIRLLNPMLLTTIVLIVYLKLCHIDFATYNQAGQFLTFWLQPAVVCLAVPLYMQWQKICKQWLIIIGCEIMGSIVGIVSGIWLAKLMGASETVQRSIAAKSVTTPIFLDVTQSIGGIPSLGFTAVLIAGILGQMVGVVWLKWLRVKNPTSQGLALGTASHALGIVSAWELSPKFAAYATVGLILNGILTAVFAPIIVHLLY